MHELIEALNIMFPRQPFELWHIPYLLMILFGIAFAFMGLIISTPVEWQRLLLERPVPPVYIRGPLLIAGGLSFFYVFGWPFNLVLTVATVGILVDTAPLGAALIATTYTGLMFCLMLSSWATRPQSVN